MTHLWDIVAHFSPSGAVRKLDGRYEAMRITDVSGGVRSDVRIENKQLQYFGLVDGEMTSYVSRPNRKSLKVPMLWKTVTDQGELAAKAAHTMTGPLSHCPDCPYIWYGLYLNLVNHIAGNRYSRLRVIHFAFYPDDIDFKLNPELAQQVIAQYELDKASKTGLRPEPPKISAPQPPRHQQTSLF